MLDLWPGPDPEVPKKAERRVCPAAYKRVLPGEYNRLTEPDAKGALLHREGLYSSHFGVAAPQ